MPVRLSYPLALACTLALAPSARADVIGGTFTGVVTQGSFLSSGRVDLTGSPVTGSFDVTSVAGAIPDYRFPISTGSYLLPLGSVSYSITIVSTNQTFNYSSGSAGDLLAGIELSDNGTRQSVELIELVNNPHLDTYINLIGPEGSLFSNVGNLASLHTGPGVTLSSPGFVSDFLNGGASYNVTSVSLSSQPVPEPPAAAMLAATALALGAWRYPRRRNATP